MNQVFDKFQVHVITGCSYLSFKTFFFCFFIRNIVAFGRLFMAILRWYIITSHKINSARFSTYGSFRYSERGVTDEEHKPELVFLANLTF